MVFSTRQYEIKKSDGYCIKQRGMVSKWKILTPTKKTCVLIIDDIPIITPQTKEKKIIDIKIIREYLKNIQPVDEITNTISRLESLFFEQQIHAMSYYHHVNDDVFSSTFFTANIKKLQLDFGKDGPETIKIEETYVTPSKS